MQEIKVPYLLNGEVAYKKIEINLGTLQRLRKVGFKINKGELLWDYSYAMSDDMRINGDYEKGARQQEQLEMILNIKL